MLIRESLFAILALELSLPSTLRNLYSSHPLEQRQIRPNGAKMVLNEVVCSFSFLLDAQKYADNFLVFYDCRIHGLSLNQSTN